MNRKTSSLRVFSLCLFYEEISEMYFIFRSHISLSSLNKVFAPLIKIIYNFFISLRSSFFLLFLRIFLTFFGGFSSLFFGGFLLLFEDFPHFFENFPHIFENVPHFFMNGMDKRTSQHFISLVFLFLHLEKISSKAITFTPPPYND